MELGPFVFWGAGLFAPVDMTVPACAFLVSAPLTVPLTVPVFKCVCACVRVCVCVMVSGSF